MPVQWLETAAGTTAPALIENGKSLSYSELIQECESWAARLSPGPVAIVGPADGRAVVFHWAALMAGSTVCHLDPDCGQQLPDRLRCLRPTNLFRFTAEEGWGFEQLPNPDPNQNGAVVFSGGTRGKVMPVHLDLETLRWSALATAEWFSLNSRDSVLGLLPFHYTLGLGNLYLAALLKAPLILAGNAVTPRSQLELVSKADFVPTVPYFVHLWLRYPEFQSGQSRFWIGSGRMNEEALAALCRRFPGRVSLLYGVAEAMGRVTATVPGQSPLSPDHRGFPLPGVQVEIEPEVRVKGANLMRGYWGESDLEPPLATGDLAEWNELTGLVLNGRHKRIAMVMGEPLALDTLRAVLLELAEVEAVETVAFPHPVLGEGVEARLTLRAQLETDRIRRHCAERLGRAYVPARLTRT